MSDENEKRVRRMRREDRKDTLPRADLRFPVDDEPEETPQSTAPGFDLDALPLPSDDPAALESLSRLSDQEFRAPVITPREERMPLLTRPEEKPTPAPATESESPAPRRGGWFFNLLTLLFLLLSIGATAWVVLIWTNPEGEFNPFPPEARYVFVSATPIGFAESTMPTPDDSGQIVIVATETPSGTVEPTQSLYPFIVQVPIFYAPNENDLGCNWWSIAGSVTDSAGNALDGYRVRITGDGVDEVVFSGAARTFGEGGFELPLIGAPQEADFVVQLFSPQEAPLSEPIDITTRADCDGNITVVNFVQAR